MKKIKRHLKRQTSKSANYFHIDKVENITGFAVENAGPGGMVNVLGRSALTSDEQEFYTYTEQISNLFLSRVGVFINSVYHFLILIHKDLSADLYINNFPVSMEACCKHDKKKGEIITKGDIVDIRRLKFPDIKIEKMDKVIYCFKSGWKFGLFFDLYREQDLDIDGICLTLGALCRYLSFQHVYSALEMDTHFEEMVKDGWFPFLELVGGEYKTISEAYRSKFDFENRIGKIVNGFDNTRIEEITNRWWKKQIFNDKREILQAGINAFLQGNQDGYINGYINCIKTLLPEIAGIIRIQYFSDTGKGHVRVLDLLEHILEKGKAKTGSDYSLFLPLPFFKYLKDVVFANFDLATGKVELSRHSSSHGVAKAEDYTKIRALQAILTLDQIYFYI